MKNKIKGLKSAVGDYQRANTEGHYSPRYGIMMFDVEDGELWTDEFYDLGHNSFKEYHSKTIIPVSTLMKGFGFTDEGINMKNVREFIEGNWDEWRQTVREGRFITR